MTVLLIENILYKGTRLKAGAEIDLPEEMANKLIKSNLACKVEIYSDAPVKKEEPKEEALPNKKEKKKSK